MEEIQQAHNELDRLQGIITRHEGHMFALRGWFLAALGGLLAAYYTDNIQMSAVILTIALFVVAGLFFLVELRHANLVEAVVERIAVIEKQIGDARLPDGKLAAGWYDGPRVCEACVEGTRRFWPRPGMTLALNAAFYVVVILIIVLATISLPQKGGAEPAKAPAAQR